MSKWILHFVQNDKPRASAAMVLFRPPYRLTLCRAGEDVESLAPGGVGNEEIQPAKPRGFLLRAGHLVDGGALVPRSLRGKEAPGFFIGAKFFFVSGGKLVRFLLEGIDAGPVGYPGGEGFEPGWVHFAGRGEPLDMADVDQAPDAAGFPWSEAIGVAVGVNFLADTINPAEAQRLIERFRVGEPGLARILAVKPHPNLSG